LHQTPIEHISGKTFFVFIALDNSYKVFLKKLEFFTCSGIVDEVCSFSISVQGAFCITSFPDGGDSLLPMVFTPSFLFLDIKLKVESSEAGILPVYPSFFRC